MTLYPKLLKQEGTARRIESMQQSSATPSLDIFGFGGLNILLYALNPPACFNSFWH